MTTYRQDTSVSYKDEEKNQVLSVIEDYNTALILLDDYDRQCMKRPEGHKATYIITYKECRNIIDTMNFKTESELFGNEKDDSFKGVLYDGDGNKKLSDYTLAVLTIMVAESKVEEKEMMITIIMNCI